jgi:hypothetical protein
MKCSELEQDILLLQHGELSPWKAFCVRHHLKNCPRCQEKNDTYRQIGRHIAATIRQDAGLPPFVFRGDITPAPIQIQKVSSHAMRLRPSVAIGATAIATIIAAGAYVYRAMALTPTTELEDSPRIIVAVNRKQAKENAPKDARGNKTIFPYSTPVMDHTCDK